MKKYRIYIIILICILAVLISICFIPISVSKLIPVVEKQVSNDLGAKIHIEHLILRLGPNLKLKTPIMHIMYEDGQKFAQFDNVKFYIPWSSLFKETPTIRLIDGKKLTVRVSSADKYLSNIANRLQNKNFNEIPDLRLKEYCFSYFDNETNEKYLLDGQNLDIAKNINYQNLKLKTIGDFSVNAKKYISYDISFVPNLELSEVKSNVNMKDLIHQIQELDFHSDIIADVKLYKNHEQTILASGFINVDNISVLDPDRKNPKSFIYLTLWGNKASILSNIYTSVNKKVYIDGMINNSKKPVLDIKVKTDEININDLYKKLKIFFNSSDIKAITSIGGTLNANFTIKGDLNKIKSNGYMKISDAYIKSQGLQVNKINSDIDFSNNTINIVNMVGYVKNAPIIARGTVDKNINIELLMNKVNLKYLLPESFGVKDGIVSLMTNIRGTLEKPEHKESLLVEHFKLANKQIDFSAETLKIDTNKNNTAYMNNIVCKTPQTASIKIPSLKVVINPDNIKIPETNIFMPNSKITAKSEIFNYNNQMDFVTVINGFINSKDLTGFESKSFVYPIKIIVSGNKYLQIINAQSLCEKTDVFDEPSLINLNAKLEKNNLKIEELSLISFCGKFSDDLKANLKGNKKLFLSGNIENIKNPILKNIRLFIPQQLNINIFDTLAQIRGDIFINGAVNNLELVGQLCVQNLFNQQMQLSLLNSTIDFNKSSLVLNAPLLKIGDSSMGINALISTNFTDGLNVKNMNIKSKYLNLDTLLMYKDTPIINQIPVVINDGKLYAERLTADIYGSPLSLSALTGDFTLKNDILSMKNFSSEMYNGKVAGSFDYNLKNELFKTKFMARNISASPIFQIISSKKETISGAMDFDTDIVGELTSKQSLNGNIKFIVNNGRMSSLGKLEHLLYAQNVIADNLLRTSLSVVTKAITLKDTGLFKYLRGEVVLENGIANVKLLQSQGPLMALYIKGIYNPITDQAKMVVLGRLSDEVVSGLGAFGEFSFNKLLIMLTGEESKQQTTPADYEKIPQLTSKNTKEFRAVINGIIDKPSSVLSFNWISYTHKSLKQKDVPQTDTKVPDFIDKLSY